MRLWISLSTFFTAEINVQGKIGYAQTHVGLWKSQGREINNNVSKLEIK